MIFVRKIQSILIYVVCPALMCGQSQYYPSTIPYLSSAKIGENFINGMNAAYNPSLIPYLKSLEAGMYAEKKYLTDINLLLLTICAPFNNNGVGLMFQHFGNSIYNERITGLNYGKNFGKIKVGILFQSIRVKIQGSPPSSFIQTGVTSTLKISDNVFWGINILNPWFNAKAGRDKLHGATSFSLIIGWQASSVAYAGLESKKEEGRPLSVLFTLQYHFAEKFSGGLNWNTSMNQPYVSIGWQLKMLWIEAGCSYHSVLGPSPTISFIFKNNGNIK